MDLNVLIAGGGIQGVGLLHDLTSRGVNGVHLVEQKQLASGASSRSTKLVHGGLRYLEHIGQWSLVHEALKERTLMLRLLRNLVKPVPFLLPNFEGSRNPLLVRFGLMLYDLLAGDSGLPSARKIQKKDIPSLAPYLQAERLKDIQSAFLYYDAQMIGDDSIVRLAAKASVKLGGSYAEYTTVERVSKRNDVGYNVTLKNLHTGQTQTCTTRAIVNAGGTYVNANLLKWGFLPDHGCVLNVGSHLVYKQEAVQNQDPSQTAAACLLQNHDGRVLFFIPWDGKWLFGTTESLLTQSPTALKPPPQDREYLTHAANLNLQLHNAQQNEIEFFCGIRSMPYPLAKELLNTDHISESWINHPFESPFYTHQVDTTTISHLSRELVISEVSPQLYSVYGGKYTTWRASSEKLGSRICKALQCGGVSGTQAYENWFLDELLATEPDIFISSPALRNS